MDGMSYKHNCIARFVKIFHIEFHMHNYQGTGTSFTTFIINVSFVKRACANGVAVFTFIKNL